jgi:hypothetical protein
MLLLVRSVLSRTSVAPICWTVGAGFRCSICDFPFLPSEVILPFHGPCVYHGTIVTEAILPAGFDLSRLAREVVYGFLLLDRFLNEPVGGEA